MTIDSPRAGIELNQFAQAKGVYRPRRPVETDRWRIFEQKADPSAETEPMGLTLEERIAVDIGREDADRYGRRALPPRSGRMRAIPSFFRHLIGGTEPLPLSNARLESFRLIACLARRGDVRLGDAVARLIALGASPQAMGEAIARARR